MIFAKKEFPDLIFNQSNLLVAGNKVINAFFRRELLEKLTNCHAAVVEFRVHVEPLVVLEVVELYEARGVADNCEGLGFVDRDAGY